MANVNFKPLADRVLVEPEADYRHTWKARQYHVVREGSHLLLLLREVSPEMHRCPLQGRGGDSEVGDTFRRT